MDQNLSWILSLVGGILPAIFWLTFWLREDNRRPEPRWLLSALFLGGALSIIPAYIAQDLLQQFWQWNTSNPSLQTIVAWAGSEELIKYLVVLVIALPTSFFDEPIDAMIYLITVALGFSAAENSLFMAKSLTESGSQVAFWLNGNYRFIGATVAHIVSSATLGSFIALGFCERRGKQIFITILGLISATLLHAIFNYLIINVVSGDILKIFILFWALAIVIIYLFERVKTIACHLETKF